MKHFPVLISKINPSARLGLSENNPGFAHIVRRDLNLHFVARDDADEILSHFSADMGENPLAVWQGYPKHRIGQNFGDRSLDNQRFLLGHIGNCLHKLQFSNGIGRVAEKNRS
jgi:hypothetical protein